MATKLQFYAILIIAATTSSFTVVHAEESTKVEDHADNAISEAPNTQEDNKDKRSQEEILFGNQQNKPNGLVDDLMAMSDEAEGESTNALSDKSNDSQGVVPLDEPSKELQPEPQNAGMVDSSQEDPWYKAMPVAPNAMQYLTNSQAMNSLPPDPYPGSLYDQEAELYRKKRQLVVRKRRSLRSSLGQMIQKRGIRMPRRSMRLKRSVDMEDLLNMVGGNERYYGGGEEEQQVTPHIFSGRAQTVVGKRRTTSGHVRNSHILRHYPGRYSSIPSRTPSYAYPYVFQHRGDGILSTEDELQENGEGQDGDTAEEDIDNLMLLPPNSRYAEVTYPAYADEEELRDEIQKWLSRHTVPSYRVQRRSAPYFYPVDYRYMPIPGYKKRSSTFRANRPSAAEDEEPGELGKWGHVVQVPEAYASPEDIARLYGLANLMAAQEEEGRRAAA